MTDDRNIDVQPASNLQPDLINFSPVADVTVPDRTDWHLVADHEIDALANPVGGVAGALGWAGLGAALGAAPAGCAAMKKGQAGAAMTSEAFTSVMILLICTTLAVVCLFYFGYTRVTAKNMLATIKSRPKRQGNRDEVNSRG